MIDLKYSCKQLLLTFIFLITCSCYPFLPQVHSQKNTVNESRRLQSQFPLSEDCPFNIVGCSYCQTENYCEECIDDLWAKNIDGKCTCIYSNQQKPDSQGYCNLCYVIGCASCDAYDSQMCFRCEDKKAQIVDGICKCPSNHVMDSKGICKKCNVFGCQQCTSNQEICGKCHDQIQTTIIDGKCICNDGKKLSVDGYCVFCQVEGCKRCQNNDVCALCEKGFQLQNDKCICFSGKYNQKGGCIDCQVKGCQKCQSRNIQKCQKCLDSSAQIIDGKCVCKGDYQFLNSTGECTLCMIPGCSICTDDKSECLECHDPSASIKDGECKCPGNKTLSKTGMCQDCGLGCNKCNENSCLQCIDQKAQVKDGQCSCLQGKQLNQFGFCFGCQVEGCEACVHEQELTCARCKDSSAKLVNGKCICPQRTVMTSNGICQECYVAGCVQCREGNPYDCLSCINKSTMKILRGKCICLEKVWYFRLRDQKSKPNQNGICERCQVDRCASCFQGKPYKCYQCLDNDAQLINGKCICPSNMPLNPDGYCQQCNAQYCKSCEQGNSTYCLQCQNDLILAEGRCICADQTKKLSYQGICQPCHILGCQRCQSQFYCEVCSQGLMLLNGKCQCEQSMMAPNQYGQCSLCLVEGCLSCFEGRQYFCRNCKRPFLLENGLCRCSSPFQKINSKGECSECKVQGCSSCSADNPLECVRCMNSSLIDGKCKCLFENAEWDNDGFCSDAHDKNNRNDFALKQEEQAQTGCGKSCTNCKENWCSGCKDGFYLLNGKCIQCVWPCKVCQQSNKCSECRKGWSLVKGQCFPCKVRKCAKCSQINECIKCKSGYEKDSEGNCVSKLLKIDPELARLYEEGGLFPDFDSYIEEYDKDYTGEQYQKRKQIYDSVIEGLQASREDQLDIKLSVNEMSDWTEEEIQRRSDYHLKEKQSKESQQLSSISNNPSRLNWVQKGAITSVKDQGQCGSGWAFAIVADAESVLILNGQYDNTIDLSQQFLIECMEENNCNGSFNIEFVMNKVLDGIPLEQTFPYNPLSSSRGICSTRKKVHFSDKNKFYYDLNQQQIIELLQSGRLVVVVSAQGWSNYQSGIFKCPHQTERSHVALLVGYDQDYWLVKNQWGQNWGEQGYIRITRNPDYNCLIGSQVFNFQKKMCQVPGCSLCQEKNPQVCLSCKDQNAKLFNNKCLCNHQEQIFSKNGYCVFCRVYGCEKCSISDPFRCESCLQGMQLTQNYQCQCKGQNNLLTTNNQCSKCQTEGCRMCAEGQLNVCSLCVDVSALIIDGKCTCRSGYYMENEKCIHCRVQGCQKCLEMQCLDCGENKIKKQGQCQCQDNSFILSYGKCVCDYGMKKSSSKCIKCQGQSCLQCFDFGSVEVCSKCSDNTFLSDGKCQKCQILGCQKCQSMNKCQKCIDSTSLINGKCLCSQPLHWISPDGQCSLCYVAGCNSCQSNDPFSCNNCIDDKSTIKDGQCQCPQNLFMSPSGICHNCSIPGCIECSSSNQCLKCADQVRSGIEDGKCLCYDIQQTFFGPIKLQSFDEPDSLGECNECKALNCQICTGKKPQKCYRCIDKVAIIVDGDCQCPQGYQMKENSLCQKVEEEGQEKEKQQQEENKQKEDKTIQKEKNQSQKVQEEKDQQKVEKDEQQNQQKEKDEEKQLQKKDQSTKDSQSLFQKQKLVPQVETNSLAVPEEYLSPQKGLYVFKNKCLLRCAVGCEQCTEEQSCSKCISKYHLVDSKCIRCHEMCRQCYGPQKDNCFSCYDGYYLKDDGCEPCRQGKCLKCTAKSCLDCMSSYVMIDSNCVKCPKNCARCDLDLKCRQCQYGFTLTDRSRCLECMVGCSLCSFNSYLSCSRCAPGYYLQNDKCQKCSDSCKRCSQKELCTECWGGYQLLLGKCKKQCQLPCIKCQHNGECLDCLGGYKLVNGRCQKDLNCTTQKPCQFCPQSYRLYQALCVQCRVENCAVCSGEDRCDRCVEGYIIEENQCSLCAEGCKSCSSISFCEICQDGYYSILDKYNKNTGICEKCSPACKKCEYGTSFCAQCEEKYIFNGWKCVSINSIDFYVEIDVSYRIFMNNINQFKEDFINKAETKLSVQDITFKTIEIGSVKINGTITNEDQEILKIASQNMKNTDQIGNMALIRLQFEDQKNSSENTVQDEDNTVWVIVGAVIGGILLIVAIVVIVSLNAKYNGNKYENEPDCDRDQENLSKRKDTE